MRFDTWTIVLGLFALSNLGNGIWMLADPPHWYATLPAAVPNTGPMNEHFIRDIGCIFLLMGAGLAVASVIAKYRVAVLVGTTGWTAAHALVHVADTLAGRLPTEHWWIDAPGVYLPTLILIAITVKIARSEADENFIR
jgi:hypothetical protein